MPGHIACDGTTESEAVVPITVDLDTPDSRSRALPVGVLDLDCQKANVWTDEDKLGLERIASWLAGKDGPIDWQTCLSP